MGRVKTRLSRTAGRATALRFYRATSAAVIGRLSADSRFETILAVAPDTALPSRMFPRAVRRMSQGRGDLGDRLACVARAAPAGPVVIVGTDIPGIRPAHVVAALRRLGRNDAVFGPADDGGYWLVGLRRLPYPACCFGGVRWSHPETLADTVANLRGRRVAMVDVLGDVDEACDLAKIGKVAGRRVLPP